MIYNFKKVQSDRQSSSSRKSEAQSTCAPIDRLGRFCLSAANKESLTTPYGSELFRAGIIEHSFLWKDANLHRHGPRIVVAQFLNGLQSLVPNGGIHLHVCSNVCRSVLDRPTQGFGGACINFWHGKMLRLARGCLSNRLGQCPLLEATIVHNARLVQMQVRFNQTRPNEFAFQIDCCCRCCCCCCRCTTNSCRRKVIFVDKPSIANPKGSRSCRPSQASVDDTQHGCSVYFVRCLVGYDARGKVKKKKRERKKKSTASLQWYGTGTGTRVKDTYRINI
eukprot:scaffold2252_cov150-Amphora_coffeaeformis.AAC.5